MMTNLGNRQLHRQHAVMIETGKIPRARVMDQHIIDRYLMRGLLTLNQHKAAEYILLQATRAHIWPTGLDWQKTGSTDGLHNYVPFGVFPLGRTLAVIRRWLGERCSDIVVKVICCNKDIGEENLDSLREALDIIDAVKLRHVPFKG